MRQQQLQIYACGDPHGHFDQINRTARERRPAAMILLGDYDLQRPLDEALAEAQEHTEIWWIPGNHDFDSDEYHDRLFASEFADRNLHGRVVEIANLRVAGLGGVFQGSIWHPHDGDGQPRFRTREGFVRASGKGNRWRGGLPRKRRSAIWWEDYEALWEQRADMLVTHEAPSCHPLGFTALDDLARAMGARLIVHGHHHVRYSAMYADGLRVQGVGQGGIWALSGEVVEPGRLDREKGELLAEQLRRQPAAPGVAIEVGR